IQQLIFGRAPVDVIVLLSAAIKHTGVAARRELPVQRQLEVGELVFRDQVTDGCRFREHSVDDTPSRWKRRSLVSAPGSRARAVKERAPARSALFSGQRS